MKRKDIVLAVLAAFFLTNAIIAELIGGKVIYVGSPEWQLSIGDPSWGLVLGPFAISVGIIPWPIVFVTTDIINEYFGRRGVRRLTILAAVMIGYVFLLLALTLRFKAAKELTAIDDHSFKTVFGQSQWIIVGSLIAFLLGQLIDVFIFHLLRKRTGKAMIWLRATGSTVISQLIDTCVVLAIGLAYPLGWSVQKYASVAVTNYSVKLGVAILMTPAIYLAHWAVETYLGKETAEALAEEAASDSASGPPAGLGEPTAG
jgi:queuosine precursor transporter